MITDDGQRLWCIRGGDNGKNLETPDDNSILGKYFRRRLSLESGIFVRKEDLDNYGRTSVAISRLDGDVFFLDFSSPKKLSDLFQVGPLPDDEKVYDACVNFQERTD